MVDNDIYSISKFQVIEPFYLHVKQNIRGEVLELEPIYKIYKCSFGAGNIPFFIIANHVKELPEGDNEKCLKVLQFPELVEYFEKVGYPDNPKIVEQLASHCKIPARIEYDEIIEGENRTKLLNIRRTMLNVFRAGLFCRITLPISEKLMQELLEDESKFKNELELYLSEKCKKDSKLLFWGRTRLVKVSNSLDDFWIEKYRGHSLIIKNPKTGFSQLAQKVGINIAYASQASVRGYADAQNNIHHGIYHANFGSIVFDEASRYKEIAADMAMTFMEQGKQRVDTEVLTSQT